MLIGPAGTFHAPRSKERDEVPIGGTALCLGCGKPFIKKTATHLFCSNGRSKKGGNCKDDYWNRAVPERGERRNDNDDDDDPSWDAHKNVF